MAEIIARVAPQGRVELIDDRSTLIATVEPMTALDAAYLARGILACAVALSGANPPKVGTIVGDAHLPIAKWATGISRLSGEAVLVLSIPSGIELTFEISSLVAKELGRALISQSEGSAPPEGHRGTVH